MSSFLTDFEGIYKTYYRMLRSVSANITRDRDASHDVVQEMFVKLYHKRADLGHVLNVKAYLCRSVVNASIAWIENNTGKKDITDMKISTGDKTDSTLMTKELSLHLENALNSLPAKCKAIFVLSRFEEMKNAEIAESLGISIKTVENQITIALRKMRQALTPYYGKDIVLLALSGSLSLIFLC
jgi:RNA polymerase sigma-70 factor (ECF subfamily)